MNEQEKSSNRFYYYIAIAIVVLSACYFLFGSGAGLHNYSDRIDELGNRVEQSAAGNRELQEQLSDAEKTVGSLEASIGRSEGAIAEAEGTTGSIEHNLTTAADAVGKCQRIIRNVKQRGPSGTEEP